MRKLKLRDVTQYVEMEIGSFHEKRIKSLDNLKLLNVLKKKNPYLYKAKNVDTPELIVRSIVDAHLSSNEETTFGEWLEKLAIFINNKVFGGHKSGIPGVDLEFDLDRKRQIVNIKSGPNWGNKDQVAKMRSNFISAKKTLRTSNSQIIVVAINGCCYGKDSKPDKGDYFKFCGQLFWEYISGEENLFVDIIEPLGYHAQEKNEEFVNSYKRVLIKFTREFIDDFCTPQNEIDWEKIVRLNSQKVSPRIPKNKIRHKKRAD